LIQKFDVVEGIDRFRISSIEPNLLNNDIIDFVARANNFVPHFHIPLQSGSDTLLKAMRRKYDQALYSERIASIKTVMPDACIGVDVIVGFPGETEEEFMLTYDYLNHLDISYLHVFTYSERANTTAKKMADAVPIHIRKERSKKLQILSEKKKRAFYESHVGSKRTVLFENEESDTNMMYGFTENYIKVKVPYQAKLANTLQEVSLTEIDRDGIFKVEFLNVIHS
jgi:threonylcarbamoyladenosine tRNA methylthiotransferase MtaB